jgi:hypothetical protein
LKDMFMKGVGILLIAAVLIAGMAGCGGDGTESCTLTISSTSGGSVTTPGHGAFTYDKGAVGNLVAEADDGYRFVSWTGSVSAITDVNASETDITMNSNYAITAEFEAKFMVSAGGLHTVGLEADGSVVAVGWNDDGECNVGNWTGIVQVAAGLFHTVGLRADGTVVAIGCNEYGQCDVSGWTDIIQVAADWGYTVGLKADGTVVALGWNDDGRSNVRDWTDIVQVDAGYAHTAGLKPDGTVVALGWNDDGRCNVGSWTDIVQVSSGNAQTVGLRDDGTVVAAGNNTYGECNVGDWDLN